MTVASLLNSIRTLQGELKADLTIEGVSEHLGRTFVLVTLQSQEDDSAAEGLLEISDHGAIRVIAMDTVLLDDVADSEVTLANLGLRSLGAGDPPDLPPNPEIPNLSIQEKVGFVAEHFLDRLSSKNVPGTNGGRLACGWATNYVIRVALGHGLGSPESMKSTINMFAALRDGMGTPVSWQEADRGDVVISPTQGSNIGHVGILLDRHRIANNSTKYALWMDHRTKESWHAYYSTKKGLPLNAFRLVG